jgi:uncharacterized DUF497 family protein
MRPEGIDWDDDDDPDGNAQHIEAADLTREEVEVEEVLDDPDSAAVPSEGAPDGEERWIVFGWTSTGRHIAVVFEILCDDPYYVKPVTAYDVPEYGDAD